MQNGNTVKVQAGAHCTVAFAQQYLVPLFEQGRIAPYPGADFYAVCYGDICAYKNDGTLLAIYDACDFPEDHSDRRLNDLAQLADDYANEAWNPA